MKKIKQIYIDLIEQIEKIKHQWWRIRLKNRNFSIISNNCWGGTISQYLNLPYNSPTVGLYFLSDDYVKFCSRLKYYMGLDLQFIDIKESKNYKYLVQNHMRTDYPVGLLGDIEIYFMHYNSPVEAIEKWNRRKQRINYSNILFKMSERDDATPQTIKSFEELVEGNKIIFTWRKYSDIESAIFTKGLKEVVMLGGSEVGITLKHFDIVRFLNDMNKC